MAGNVEDKILGNNGGKICWENGRKWMKNGRKIGGKMAGNVEDKMLGNSEGKIFRKIGWKWKKNGWKCGR
jgi:hypothetical protein